MLLRKLALAGLCLLLNACSNSSDVGDMYGSANLGGGWGIVQLGCNDAYCLATR
jgi:hypothetical protein